MDIRSKVINFNKTYKVFFDDSIPAYFRVDIYKILATYISLAQDDKNEPTFFAYFDLSIDPINLKSLYRHQKSKQKLEKYGIILGKTDLQSYENSFHVMRNIPELLLAINRAVIYRGIYKIKREASNQNLPFQFVYASYRTMMLLYHALMGRSNYFNEYDDGFSSSDSSSEEDNKKPAKPFSKKELISLLEYKRLNKPGKGLFYKSDDIFFKYKEGKIIEEDKNSGILNTTHAMPTRSCISKTSKINQ